MSDQTVNLEIVLRLIHELQADMRSFRAEMAEFREQVSAQTPVLARLEASQAAMTERLGTIAAQHQRTDRRLLVIAEQLSTVERR